MHGIFLNLFKIIEANKWVAEQPLPVQLILLWMKSPSVQLLLLDGLELKEARILENALTVTNQYLSLQHSLLHKFENSLIDYQQQQKVVPLTMTTKAYSSTYQGLELASQLLQLIQLQLIACVVCLSVAHLGTIATLSFSRGS